MKSTRNSVCLRKNNPLRAFVFVGLIQLVFSLPKSAQAQTPALPQKHAGRQIALLIGVEQYPKVPALKFVRNDVTRLAEVLRERGGFNEVVELSDGNNDETRWPRKDVVMAAVSKWLQGRNKNDTVFVYFSGHGFRDPNGTMYLAPLDTDPANLSGTGIPVAWFRDQLASCKASLKMLVLDACHAGSLKGVAETNLNPQDLEMFEKLEGVVTLASSMADQPSQMWAEKTQSLYTYWLAQGLKGHADTDSNGEINIDELYDYVYRNVSQTAEAQNRNLPQTPVRKIGFGLKGQPVVLYLKPQSLDQLLNDMGQQLADVIVSRKLEKVGVLEFTNDTKLGELLGANYGVLGQYCSTKLEDRLVQERRGRYTVVNKRTLQQALKDKQFQLADLGSGDALKRLAAGSGGTSIPVIAIGTLHGRLGAMVNLRCQLIEAEQNEIAAVVGGSAWLTDSQIAMMCKSFAVYPDDRRPKVPAAGEQPQPPEYAFIDRIDKRSEGPHPLQDPNNPYRVWISVNGKERKGEFRGNDYFVPLRKNEVYEIMIENRSGQRTFMRLLVDGLNTLPEKDSVPVSEPSSENAQTPTVASESKGLTTEIIGKPVNLEVARGWILDPNDTDRIQRARLSGINPNLYAIRGFVTKTGKQGRIATFKVVDAENSLAARRSFTSQIGIITAAFYQGTAARGGTAPDKEIDADLEEVQSGVGSLLGSINIRYYDPDEPAAKN